MKIAHRVVTVLSFSVLTSSIVFADVKDEIKKMDKAYDEALIAKDAKVFQELFDETGTFIDEKGRHLDKRQYIKMVMDKKTTTTSAKSVPISIREFGDIVIETGVYTSTGKTNGKPFRVRIRYTDVWTKKSGKWTILAEQGTLIETKK